MNITIEEHILNCLDLLIKVIDMLPYSVDIKTVLKYMVATDFHESVQFNDKDNSFKYSEYSVDQNNPNFNQFKTTKGIDNINQLHVYLREFNSHIVHIGQSELQHLFFTPVPIILNAELPLTKLNIRQVTRFDLLKRYHLNFILDSDIDDYLHTKIYSDFPHYDKGIDQNMQLPNVFNYLYGITRKAEQTVYEVEELEILLCILATQSIKSLEIQNQSYKHDSESISNLIGELFDQYVDRMKQKLRTMEFSWSIKYLEISCSQFVLFTPESRRKNILERFKSIYYFPLRPHNEIPEYLVDYFSSLFNTYSLHFDKFRHQANSYFTVYKSSPDTKLKYLRQKMFYPENNFNHTNNTFVEQIEEESYFFSYNDFCKGWINCTTTLLEWQHQKDYGLISYLKKFPISEDEWARIHTHQLGLYNEHVENLFLSKYKDEFEEILSDADKILIAKRDISLIDDIVTGKIEGEKAIHLKLNFSIDNYRNTKEQLENIIRKRYKSDSTYDIHHPDCYANTEALYKYKIYLSEFISAYEIPQGSDRKKSDISKAPPFSSNIAYSYIYIQNNSPAITVLLSSLKNKKFISDKNGISDFRKIFDNQLPDKLIIWTGTFGELHHFILLMHHEYKVIKKIPNIWKVTAELFVDENLTKYDASKFHLQPLPARMSELIKIVERLKLEPGK